MPEKEHEPPHEYPTETRHGTTVADHRHVSADEAEHARDVGEAQEQLPEPDPRFDVT